MALRVRVCRVSDVVPDELRAFRVKGVTWPVMVMIVEGTIVATAGVCPHEDVELADGYLVGKMVICPAHAYSYDVTTGKCTHDPDLNLRRYAVTIVGDEVWADLL
jgi:nitrite reductase/ring-hydroxylating ferredoxin subunit